MGGTLAPSCSEVGPRWPARKEGPLVIDASTALMYTSSHTNLGDSNQEQSPLLRESNASASLVTTQSSVGPSTCG
jgi:hypothetical protein